MQRQLLPTLQRHLLAGIGGGDEGRGLRVQRIRKRRYAGCHSAEVEAALDVDTASSGKTDSRYSHQYPTVMDRGRTYHHEALCT
jgi:hypothetical protein